MLQLMSLTPLTAEQADMLRIAEVCGEQLLLVIEDILDLTNLADNKLSLKYQSFSMKNTLVCSHGNDTRPTPHTSTHHKMFTVLFRKSL